MIEKDQNVDRERSGMSEVAQTPMKDAVREAMEEQIAREFYAAYLYLSMSGSLEAANLPGFARWMRARGEAVRLRPIEEPPHDFRSPLDTFEQSLEHERRVTSHIHDLYDLAVSEHDYPAQVLLNWFVSEQVEEEKSATEIVERLRMAGEDTAALLMLDKELGERGREL